MIIDTSIIIDRIRNQEEIDEDITIVSVIELPQVLEYKMFNGKTVYPLANDYELAYNIQRGLLKIGKPKPFSDILIAAIAINRDEELLTKDRDFIDIEKVTNLKLVIR